MKIKVFPMGSNLTNCYIVFDENTKEAFCVDVSDKIHQNYFDFIKKEHLNIRYLFLTHGHYDHTQDIRSFHLNFPDTKIIISKTDYDNIQKNLNVFCEKEKFVQPDFLCEEGSEYTFCGSVIRTLATPGHTAGSVCYLYGDGIFCGDTIFHGSVGRTDLPTGSFFDILNSVRRVSALGDYKLYPGHMDVTDMATEKKINEYFRL